MAERRMFSKTIVDSDNFMGLSFSAQAAYFHLAMRADDDGFVGNARSILRMVGAGDEELQELINSGYIREFQSGVIGVVHWKVHNYIQKDRYKPSVYTLEKSQMYPTDTESDTEDTDVSNSDTQDRLGKDRLGKDSTGKDSTGKDSTGKDRSDKDNTHTDATGTDNADKKSNCEKKSQHGVSDGECQKIIDLYNSICCSLPQVSSLTNARRQAISLLLKKHTREQIAQVFRDAQQCDFLCGKGQKGWKASFDWLVNEDNFLRVSEGAYKGGSTSAHGSYDIEAYERYSIFD